MRNNNSPLIRSGVYMWWGPSCSWRYKQVTWRSCLNFFLSWCLLSPTMHFCSLISWLRKRRLGPSFQKVLYVIQHHSEVNSCSVPFLGQTWRTLVKGTLHADKALDRAHNCIFYWERRMPKYECMHWFMILLDRTWKECDWKISGKVFKEGVRR